MALAGSRRGIAAAVSVDSRKMNPSRCSTSVQRATRRWSAILSANGSLLSPNFVERLRESCVWRHWLKTSSTLVLVLIDCFEHYESSVEVEFFRANSPNLRRKANARNFRCTALLHVADHTI